jgi:anaerobic selenocysteine-containing dehydrogenase
VSNKYTPSAVAEMTGVKAREIEALAKAFAGAKAPIALFGRGKGYLTGSLYEFMAVHSLNALVGNINRPGGVLVHDPLPLAPLAKVEPDAVAAQGLAKGRLDRAKTADYPFTHSLINNLSEAILQSAASPVDTLLVFAANPAFTLPDGGAFAKALKKVPFIVSFSPFRDETASMADLVLPDHVFLEKTDDVTWPAGLQYPLYGVTKPVVKPVYRTRNAGDVILALAKRLGGAVASAFPWEKYEAVLEARAKGLFGLEGGLVRFEPGTGPAWKRLSEGAAGKPDYSDAEDMWKKLVSGGLWYRPFHNFGGWERLFKTPTGRFEFFSTQIITAVYESAQRSSEASARKAMGIGAEGEEAFLPHFEPSPFASDKGSYPLVMLPYEIINLASGWIPNPPFLNKTLFDNQLLKDDSFAEISPLDAAKYGLREGDTVTIESTAGKARVRVTLFEGAMPGVVYVPLGLGHAAYDEFLRGKGANPNHIISPAKDPLSGHPIWWQTPVRIVKV